jgi:predicted DsbA family dithiol-disulfide isomerase
MERLKIDVWSDIACPWCFIGKRRLEAALREFPDADQVVLEWRSFELDPRAPRVRDKSLSHKERLAKKYGVTMERAQAMHERLQGVAAEEGLRFDFERIQSGNTFDAHRLLSLARQRGLQEALEERFMHAYLCEGAAIGDQETLVRLSTEVGLAADEARAVLATDLHASEVRADEQAAHALGISGVPFFRIGRYGVEGAQPAQQLASALIKAWEELPPSPVLLGTDGPTCGPDGCD